jgi:glycosyltransferase involved in cell wall biosynthesis
MPRVTLCIPAFNASATITETLESLLAQTYGDKEIVVSDNHSTDDTKEVVAGFAKRGVRLVVCPHETIHTGSLLDNCLSGIQNWNSQLGLGTGEYVGIYHADDIYDPEMVGRQVEALDRCPGSSAAFTRTRAIASTASDDGVAEEWFGLLDLIRHMLRVGQDVSSSGPLIRRAAWRQAGSFDAHTFEQAVDSDFWIRLAEVGPVAVLSPAMVRYRVHLGQDSSRRYALYRHRPEPFMKVIQHWVSRPEIHRQLTQRDRDFLEARRNGELLRIALTHAMDGHRSEAKSALEELPGLWRSLGLVFAVERPRWLLGVARILSVRFLSLSLLLGGSRRAATAIARARPGLRGWAQGNPP